MQPNELNLYVDELNDGNTVLQPYMRYEEQQNRTTYIGATHTPDARDTITLYRSFPTKSGNFKGAAKSSVKLTEDATVSGVDGSTSLTSPIIAEVSFSLPVGVNPAAVKEVRQRLIAILDDDSFMESLSIQLMV